MSDWLDIDTAPKDGREIEIIDFTAPYPAAGLAHWGTHFNGFAFRAGSKEDWDCSENPQEEFGYYLTPTHWKPLPGNEPC